MKLIHLTGDALHSVCVSPQASLREAMAVMNAASLRLVPVVDTENQKLFGVLADGDIRRYLAQGGYADDLVSAAAIQSPRLFEGPLPFEAALTEMLTRNVEYLPVVEDGAITALFVLWAVHSSTDITAVIMAGGLGSRLAPYTDNCPKPLVDLGGRPILSHVFEHLRECGITRFVLCLNYLGDMIVDRYGNGSALGIDIDYVREPKRLGTGGALSLIPPSLLSDPFYCMNGDILTDINIDAFRQSHDTGKYAATMAVRDFHYTVPYGVIRRDENGKYLANDEKPTLSFPINTGMYLLNKETLSLVPKDSFFDLPSLFTKIMEQGRDVGTFSHDGRWIDIGTISELERARRAFEGTT